MKALHCPCSQGYDCCSGGYLPEQLIMAVAKAIAESYDDGVGLAGETTLANGSTEQPLWSPSGEKSARERALKALSSL